MEEFGPFLEIENHIPQLKEREETRRTVVAMLELIRESSDYVRENASPNLLSKS